MKERPILFNDEMVRALLDGRKTQTRRLLKPQPGTTPDDYPGAPGHWWPCNDVGSMVHVERELQNQAGGWEGFAGTVCPYGQPGDRLWVREACRAEELGTGLDGVRYVADEDFVPIKDCQQAAEAWLRLHNYRSKKYQHGSANTVPSIHMPRWACRLLLEITAVRVERLQDISEADSSAEGCDNSETEAAQECGWCEKPRRAFRRVWERISGPESWNANPWVWVVEFKRIDQQQEAA